MNTNLKILILFPLKTNIEWIQCLLIMQYNFQVESAALKKKSFWHSDEVSVSAATLKSTVNATLTPTSMLRITCHGSHGSWEVVDLLYLLCVFTEKDRKDTHRYCAGVVEEKKKLSIWHEELKGKVVFLLPSQLLVKTKC